MRTSALLLLACSALAHGQSSPGGGWKNVTVGVGGDTWGYAGVTLMACAPDRDEVIAGVSESGLWSSADGGSTWKKLGGTSGAQIKNRPHQILFDPKDSKTWWLSGNYGAGIFKTTDGGASFRRLGKLDHVDGIAVDFSDPARRTLLAGLHEQERSLHVSRDAGETWEKIGERLPEDSNFSSDPLILDSKTFLVNAAGWKKGKSWGIYRSGDAGMTWSKVSELGPGGRALQASGGEIYWQAMWGGGLVKSADRGATWSKTAGPAKTNAIELPGGKLAALSDSQLFVSSNGGVAWEKAGEPVPIKAQGLAYSAKRRAFYVWRMSDKKSTETVYRLDWPE